MNSEAHPSKTIRFERANPHALQSERTNIKAKEVKTS